VPASLLPLIFFPKVSGLYIFGFLGKRNVFIACTYGVTIGKDDHLKQGGNFYGKDVTSRMPAVGILSFLSVEVSAGNPGNGFLSGPITT